MVPHLFRKNIAARKHLKIKKMGIYNLLASMDASECLHAIDTRSVEHFTALNSFGLDQDTPYSNSNTTYFIDRTWLIPVDKSAEPKPKSLRLDQLHKRHALDLERAVGIERLYLVNARHKPEGTNGCANSTPNSSDASPRASVSINCSNGSKSSRSTPVPSTNLRDLYMDSICNFCGPTLQHLILPSRWPLNQVTTARLIRAAPNLTQLSAAILCTDMDVMRLLVPFLTKLWAIRVVAPTQEGPEGMKQQTAFFNFINYLDDEVHQNMLAKELAGPSSDSSKSDFPRLRYVGLGPKIFEIGGTVEDILKVPVLPQDADQSADQGSNDHILPSWEPMHSNTGLSMSESDTNGLVSSNGWREVTRYRRRVKRITEDDVKNVEIWKMDSMDVI